MVIETDLHLGEGIVRGNVFSIRRYITRIPSGATVSSAKLTVKTNLSDSDANAIFQLSATIEAAGSTGTAIIRFDLTAANTNALTADTDVFFDIRVTMASGDILTIESGMFAARAKVTD